MIISRRRLQEAVHHLPQLDLVYVNNAKVACSSIKKALWTSVASFPEEGSPHDRRTAPFSKGLVDMMRDQERFLGSTFFSVARNPYSRILSAYLDKVQRETRDTAVWHPFARRFRLRGDARPSFADFLRLVISEDPSLLDQHFAPQYINVLQPLVACDFVGHIEDMDAVWSFLKGFRVEPAEHRPHNTDAAQLASQFYGPTEVDLVRSYFDTDFEVFGYGDDPMNVHPVRPVAQLSRPRSVLGAFMGIYTSARAESRKTCLEHLREHAPEILTQYNELENQSINVVGLQDLTHQAVSGNIDNWKLVALIAGELLRHDMVDQSVSVTHRAQMLMHPA